MRSAVENLLRQRRMNYNQNKPGSFLVKADTGETFYHRASTEPDTKILISERENDSFNLRSALSRSALSRSSPLNTERTELLPPQNHMNGPSLMEVASVESLLEKAIQESLESHRQEIKQGNKKQKEELRIAIELSRRLLQTEEDQVERELDESLQMALNISKTEAQKWQQEEAVLQRVLTESAEKQKDSLLILTDQEIANQMEEAIKLSVKEQTLHATDDDDEVLKRVLEQSKLEEEQKDFLLTLTDKEHANDLEEAVNLSATEQALQSSEEGDEIKERVLELSLEYDKEKEFQTSLV